MLIAITGAPNKRIIKKTNLKSILISWNIGITVTDAAADEELKPITSLIYYPYTSLLMAVPTVRQNQYAFSETDQWVFFSMIPLIHTFQITTHWSRAQADLESRS